MVIEILSSLPSVVVGLFVFLVCVVQMQIGFSILAGAIALTFFNLPLLTRNIEESIKAVPNLQLEGGLALGLSKWKTITKIILPEALPGIITGVILSAGRVFGEAAALLYTAGQSTAINWNNWNLVLATDADRNAAGYAEYFVLRCDNYGWGDANYNAANITLENYPTNDEEWKTFRENMEGAQVKITIQRVADMVNVTAVATCPNGTVYTERYTQSCGDGTQVVRACLACDASHFIMDPNNCYLVEPCFE